MPRTGTQRGITTWIPNDIAGAASFGQPTDESSQYVDGIGADHIASRTYSYW